MTTPAINLRTASPAEINAAVAEHVAKYKWGIDPFAMPPSVRNNFALGEHQECWLDSRGQRVEADFVFNSNAVIVLLEEYQKRNGWIQISVQQWHEKMVWTVSLPLHHSVNGPTFNLAAIAALLRANGVEVVE